MKQAKWLGTLSTTGPYNHLGLIKVRQGNQHSETFELKIVVDEKPYDLTGLRVFFSTSFEPYKLVEKEAVVVDAVKGIIRFTMDDDCLYQIGRQRAYFEIFKEAALLDSTQDFTYQIEPGLLKKELDASSYIQRLEDLLASIDGVIEETQGEIREWFLESKAEIEQQLVELQEKLAENQIEFDQWFTSIQAILTSIDPGGVLLNEIIVARKNYKTLNERLLSDQMFLERKIEEKVSKDVFLEGIKNLKEQHYTLAFQQFLTLQTIQDNRFSLNHEVIYKKKVVSDNNHPALVIAEIDSPKEETFYLQKVGEI